MCVCETVVILHWCLICVVLLNFFGVNLRTPLCKFDRFNIIHFFAIMKRSLLHKRVRVGSAQGASVIFERKVGVESF
jgi:hypothetical protein